MPELQRLHPGHAPAVLAFELANRAYFAAFISDRGDEYFDQFPGQHRALLAEQEAGAGAYYVLVAEDGSVLGRFNLYRVGDGTAELGYRVAQRRRRATPPLCYDPASFAHGVLACCRRSAVRLARQSVDAADAPADRSRRWHQPERPALRRQPKAARRMARAGCSSGRYGPLPGNSFSRSVPSA